MHSFPKFGHNLYYYNKSIIVTGFWKIGLNVTFYNSNNFMIKIRHFKLQISFAMIIVESLVNTLNYNKFCELLTTATLHKCACLMVTQESTDFYMYFTCDIKTDFPNLGHNHWGKPLHNYDDRCGGFTLLVCLNVHLHLPYKI